MKTNYNKLARLMNEKIREVDFLSTVVNQLIMGTYLHLTTQL